MTRHEQDIEMTARLYECRKAAKFILGDKYETTLKPWREVIESHMKAKRRAPLQAVLDLSTKIYNDVDGTALMLLFAAAVEIMEQPPSVDAVATSVPEGKAVPSRETEDQILPTLDEGKDSPVGILQDETSTR